MIILYFTDISGSFIYVYIYIYIYVYVCMYACTYMCANYSILLYSDELYKTSEKYENNFLDQNCLILKEKINSELDLIQN